MKVYQVLRETDLNEGRSGYGVVDTYATEELAWRAANKLAGIVGRRPDSGDWRASSMTDVTVKELVVLEEIPMTYDEALEEAAKKLPKEVFEALRLKPI